MTTKEVADKLVELCRQNKIDEVLETLYADNAKSIEASDMMGPREVEGLQAIKAKSAEFQADVEEFHGATISDPIIAANSFALIWTLDATFKGRGRMTMEEVCVYQVKDGKVILEQFFY
ncbi:SnoaL-like domain-containing protein [Dyadobacter subterraneus]|uniref:Nuclear transport factor 2 family protein n=1 Tax=Dyadobacter subterraneus TaxID=2773304 RepID=A0ABR9W670_9BACT|nr:nuclear transport factor 2 family protein [Dyadobacter subterraneus]MBE9460471.1 nuclear transport factor 2 family protein [Dyadobacter subterraneus]